ncbi:MAG: hypothetical protein ABIM30_05955 [candidate division WOR-3 bacterium]
MFSNKIIGSVFGILLFSGSFLSIGLMLQLRPEEILEADQFLSQLLFLNTVNAILLFVSGVIVFLSLKREDKATKIDELELRKRKYWEELRTITTQKKEKKESIKIKVPIFSSPKNEYLQILEKEEKELRG